MLLNVFELPTFDILPPGLNDFRCHFFLQSTNELFYCLDALKNLQVLLVIVDNLFHNRRFHSSFKLCNCLQVTRRLCWRCGKAETRGKDDRGRRLRPEVLAWPCAADTALASWPAPPGSRQWKSLQTENKFWHFEIIFYSKKDIYWQHLQLCNQGCFVIMQHLFRSKCQVKKRTNENWACTKIKTLKR